MMPQPTVFLSYSHQDEIWKDRIAEHLRVLGELEVWDDQRIALGEDWFPAIVAALEKSRIAILVVSAAFLTSRFILGEEIPRLLKLREEKGLAVIPVIACPCAWETVDWLARMQCFPKGGRALSLARKARVDEALATLTLRVKEKLESQSQPAPVDLPQPAPRNNHQSAGATGPREEALSPRTALPSSRAGTTTKSRGIPTLVIGLGGTGVLTLRALKKLFHTLPPEQRVPTSFLAFDFDREGSLGSNDPQNSFADLDETEFFCLNLLPIHDLLRNLDRSDDAAASWRQLLHWFPDRARVSANGTGQLRALGRLGLFLNDEVIERTVRRKLADISAWAHDSLSQRVVLVSSVAGGTGAGMLIDMAYISRRQATRPRVFAYLLLPEILQDSDAGGNIYQNSYACLKELAILRDQQIPFEAEYYRIPPVFVPVGGEEPFSRIFLYRGARAEACASREATIWMAESILSQLVPAIQERTLSIISNTLVVRSPKEESRRRLGCFSTTSSISLPFPPVESAKERIREALGRPSQEVFEQRTPNPQRKTLSLVMLPEKPTWSLGDREAFRSFLEASTTQAFSGPALVDDDTGSTIRIYSEDLFHPLEHIRALDLFFAPTRGSSTSRFSISISGCSIMKPFKSSIEKFSQPCSSHAAIRTVR